MKKDPLNEVVFSPAVVEFTTVCVQFCAYLEESQQHKREEFVLTTSRILALLYLKTSLLPNTSSYVEESLEKCVDEASYTLIANQIQNILGEEDTYLEVFMEGMKYSDTPIAASISEDLADIYQDLKDFTYIYSTGITENMNEALFICHENFKSYWGQKLVNVLRALHQVNYNSSTSNSQY